MSLDVETEQYYENFLDLFSHPGWKQYISECEEYLQEVDSITACNSADEFWFNKGRVFEYLNTVQFEETCRRVIDEASEE